MKPLLLFPMLFLSFSLFGQTLRALTTDHPLPDSPSETRLRAASSETPSETAFPVQPVRPIPPPMMIRTAPVGERKHVMNRSFILVSLFQVGATIADLESTQYGISRGYKEGNPFFGAAASRPSQYAIAMPIAAGVAAWSYTLKRRAPHSRYWMIPQTVIGSIHTAAAIHNAAVAR
jgi:hypothetical protein